MAKKSERSLLLVCMLFVFVCLLLSGGWRLVGSEEENNLIRIRPVASVRAVLTSPSEQRIPTGSVIRKGMIDERIHAVAIQDHLRLTRLVQSDANGNVLAGRTYMRAVYQAFVLDDGFV